MATMLSSILPPPTNAPLQAEEDPAVAANKRSDELARKSQQQLSLVAAKPPAYGSRKGWVPSKPEDYGDGGA